MKQYTYEDAYRESLEYFEGDELAANIFITKYALQANDGTYLEKSPDDMHLRMAREFARIEKNYPNPMSEEDIYSLFRKFKYVVPQGSPMSGIGNKNKIQSLSNCFVIESPFDSYSGILKTDQEQVQIMKRRGGVGFDISNIRPKGLDTSNAAKTTDGIEVFMDRFSNSCREVAQGGRRGALMITVSVHHPQIMEFVKIKQDLTRVTGANISIRLTDEFMTAVKKGDNYHQRWPVDSKTPTVSQMADARELWDEIIVSAHGFAEPGLLFWDTAIKMTPSDVYSEEGFGSTSTNPCVVGQTLIAVADGRNAVSIKQLAIEGHDVPVYCTNPDTGRTEIKMGRNPRKTGEFREVWKLVLDDGTTLIATPDHKVLTKNLEYVEIKDLKPGTSLIPFNTFNSNSYRQICNTGASMSGGAKRNRRQYRLIHNFHHGETNSKKYAIHHVDYNSKNDSVDNLKVMLHEEHRRLHADGMMGADNPYFKMTDLWKKDFASHPGKSNGRYSGYSNEAMICEGRKVFLEHGKFTSKLWQVHAKKIGAPQFVGNKFRFGTWNNFKSVVVNNHKVAYVEKVGNEDVYNITVDDYHNYNVITSFEEGFVKSSGICVKNCGEIILSPYDSCRLMLINLTSFITDSWGVNSYFNFGEFADVVQKAQRLMDDMIDLEVEQVEKIIQKIEEDPEPDGVKQIEKDLWENIQTMAILGRRTGLGITGLGDALAMLGITYGSEDSVAMTEEIYKQLALNSYDSSIQLAKERGSFPAFDFNKEKNHPFLDRILSELLPSRVEDYVEFGRRNIANTTTAPAGSVSMLTQTTSGIEPAFMLHYTRRKKINPNDENATVDFIDNSGDSWTEFQVYHHNFSQWLNSLSAPDVPEKFTNEQLVKLSPYSNATANEIDWINKVKLQSVAQKWVCHAISNTTNLPNDVDIETVKKVYMTGWESGCKGITVYRDGCRSGVLVAASQKSLNENTFADQHAPRRPEVLDCEIHQANIKGKAWTILVGLMNGRPYEVIGGLAEYVEISRKHKYGKIRRRPRKSVDSKYDLIVGTNGDEMIINDVITIFANPNHSSFTRTISLALRHGAPIQYVVEQLQKDKDADLFSFSKVIARCLKKHIPDGTVGGDKDCASCGAENSLKYQEGCVACTSCGSSKCG